MKAYTKDIIKTIIKGKKRFLALMLITALGVCMQCGLTASCDDLRISADRFFDEQNLMDISIVSTMGLTEKDVAALAKLPGVDDVEGAYSETVFTEVEGQTKQADVRMLSDKDINMPYLLRGELPMRADEIVVTNKYLTESGKDIGDIIVIEEDMDDEEDEDEEETEEEEDNRFELNLEKPYDEDESTKLDEEDMEVEVEEEEEEPNFLCTKYTIVGVVIDVTDVNSSEGAVSFRSNSTTDYTFFVLPEAISSDIFTAVYITLTGTDELLCYTDEYEARVDEVVSILEEQIKADREKIRYDEVTGEAMDKVDEAESEMYDKFDEVEEDLYDAKEDIEEGWSDLLEGKLDLFDGKFEIGEGERELAKAQRELESAERQLAKLEAQLSSAWEELESGETALEEGEATLEEAEINLDESEATLDETEEAVPERFEGTRKLIRTEMNTTEVDIKDTTQKIEKLKTEIAEYQEDEAALLEKDKTTGLSSIERVELLEVQSKLTESEAELELREEELDTLNEQLDTYNETLKDLDEQEADAYEEIAEGRKEIADGRKEIAENREELEANRKELEEGRADLEEAQKEFDDAKMEVEDGWAEVEEGWEELEEGYKDLSDGESELEEGQAQFEDGKQEYEEGLSEYEDKRNEAIGKIEDARQEINDLKMTEWYITTRTGLSGYNNIKTDAECIESIGSAFPILFLTVAILISLTTISRMVEEDRGLIGTYKALGFTDKEIRRKYVIYALLACVFGGMLGDFFGFVVLPKIIFTVFGVMYDLQNYMLAFDVFSGIGAILLFVVGIGGAAFVSCSTTLAHMPAVLMRPKAPKNGSRVLLERITPLWSRLSFLNKVTARNLFRYKKRLFMTLFGIAGCTSLLLAGYTIKDTITEMMPLQCEKTTVYDLMVVADDDEKMLEYLKEDSAIRSYIHPMISNIKIMNEEGKEETVQLIVLAEGESLRGYINLYTKDNEKLRLEDGNIFTTINVANILGYTKGDTVTMQTMGLDTADVEVTEITMNYLGNYV